MGETNKIRIIADAADGLLFVNDDFVTALDLSHTLNKGNIRIYGKVYTVIRSRNNEADTQFNNVKLWHLGE